MTVRHFDSFNRYVGSGADGGLRSAYNIQSSDSYFDTSATTRTGTGQSLFINGDVQFNPRELIYDWGVNDTSFGIGFYFRMPNVSACSTRSSTLFLCVGDGSNRQMGLQLLSSGQITICRAGGVFGGSHSPVGLVTSSPADAVISGVWHLLEWTGTIDNVTGSSTLKLDGKVIADVSGVDTQTTGNNTVSSFMLDNFNISGGDWNLDDLYITDGATLGGCRVDVLPPTADTVQADFTPLGAGDNYVEVDELPSDNDTSYVESSTVGHFDLYECADLSDDTPLAIFAVKVAGHMKKDDTGARTGRLLLKSGATTDEGSDFLPNETSYLSYHNIYNTDPNTAAAWTAAAVNAIQIGPKVQA